MLSENTSQLPLLPDLPSGEDPRFLSEQLITCIGNKRALLPKIGGAIDHVKRRLAKEKLALFDAFAGSGVVSRYFKGHAEWLVTNDIEDFSVMAAHCYLRNASDVDGQALADLIAGLNDAVDDDSFGPGFIEELYSPRDENNITVEDRVFYTRRNARRLDNYRRLISRTQVEWHPFLLGPLLSEASVHANTAGVFKGFYKDRKTKIGKFGGTNADALTRILGEVRLAPPVFSRFHCDVTISQEDANQLAPKLAGIDLAYIDPPYNQHPYGSNYFMLNLLLHYNRPEAISLVSGIPKDWRRSGYNVRSRCLPLLKDLATAVDAKFLLISFNDEGFIPPDEMKRMLADLGRLQVIELKYNTFRGSGGEPRILDRFGPSGLWGGYVHGCRVAMNCDGAR